jgi:hypothetical protein
MQALQHIWYAKYDYFDIQGAWPAFTPALIIGLNGPGYCDVEQETAHGTNSSNPKCAEHDH